MRCLVVLSICAATLTACGSHSRRAGPAPPTNDRVEHCVNRMFDVSTVGFNPKPVVRRYLRDAYCRRFEQKGWINEDGTLKIAVQRSLQTSGTCGEGIAGQPPKVVPCKPERDSSGALMIDCGLLRFVRRSEVRTYLRRLQPVACEQGIPVRRLGVP
jgi:hypothetical protein